MEFEGEGEVGSKEKISGLNERPPKKCLTAYPNAIRQRSNIQKIQFSQESMLPAPFFIMHQKAILPN